MRHDESALTHRANLLRVLVGSGFLLLFVALFSLQVLQQSDFAAKALENRQFRERVRAPRGRVLDRNGITLVDNRHQARLSLSLAGLKKDNPTFMRLTELLELDGDLVLVRSASRREADRATILKHANVEQIAIVEEHRSQLPDVQLNIEPLRQYRFGSMAAHVLGYIGEVDPEDVAASGRFGPYASGDMKGVSGLEGYVENLLRGRHGTKVVEVNAANHVVGELEGAGRPVIPGVHFYLSLSQPLQKALEELLEGRIGSGVVLEVPTGDILAIASSPSFDPNLFAGGLDITEWKRLESDPRQPLYNRSLQGAYPPGSPYKLIGAACALELGRVNPSTVFQPCTGSYRFGNRIFRCWQRTEGHGLLDLEGAIIESCDVYFYQLGQLLTIDELAATARRFGLGESSGLEFEADRSGLVPDSDFYDRRFGRGQWTRGVLLNNIIGQGELLATPLQMARAYAALGGDGHLYRPNLILARENASGVREVRRVRRVSETVCSDRVRSFLKRALLQVVEHEEGTGGLAQLRGIAVAGKTGTAENPHGEDHAWFVAYAPAEDPEIAVALIVENAGHGGAIAAPMVRALMNEYFSARQPLSGELGK
ncbi:MAG TPA: penicillin-binding protein 2 [Candidatus Krumholzibacteria bacterium]